MRAVEATRIARRRGEKHSIGQVGGSGELAPRRSRLHRNEISQVNMRWKALAEIDLHRDTAENEPCEVCEIEPSTQLASRRSPRAG